MADALCGPSNALQNFQKHTSVDRTLQQDRIASRQSSSQSFRSHNPAENSLDHDFHAFESGIPGPSLQERPNPLSLFQPAPNHMPQQSHPHQAPSWTADFQRLEISAPSHFAEQKQFTSNIPGRSINSSGWTNEFSQSSNLPMQSQNIQGMAGHAPMMGNMGFSGASQFMTPGNQHSNLSQMQPPPQASEEFDETAFEAAFAEARAEVELQEVQQAPELEEVADQLEETIEEPVRIGSDSIPAQLDGINESDELARTAGDLLDRVGHEQNQKFKESNFLALMRQLRDREIVVEGDEFRQVPQPLHPGGPFFPEQSRPPFNPNNIDTPNPELSSNQSSSKFGGSETPTGS